MGLIVKTKDGMIGGQGETTMQRRVTGGKEKNLCTFNEKGKMIRKVSIDFLNQLCIHQPGAPLVLSIPIPTWMNTPDLPPFQTIEPQIFHSFVALPMLVYCNCAKSLMPRLNEHDLVDPLHIEGKI